MHLMPEEPNQWKEIEDDGFIALVGLFYKRRDASGLHPGSRRPRSIATGAVLFRAAR